MTAAVRSTTATVHRAVYRTDDAAVNLKRSLRSTSCTIEATDRHEALRGLSATAGLLLCQDHSHWKCWGLTGVYSIDPLNQEVYACIACCLISWLYRGLTHALQCCHYKCLKKTGPLRLIWHNFINSQYSLIIFNAARPYSIWASCVVSIATVAIWRSVSQKPDHTIFSHNSIKKFFLY